MNEKKLTARVPATPMSVIGIEGRPGTVDAVLIPVYTASPPITAAAGGKIKKLMTYRDG